MFKKLIVLAALTAGVVAFVGSDVVGSTWHRARAAVRETLSANVPLKTQLAEARAQVDAYAEHVIKAEVAAEGLARTITETEREVRGLAARVERERMALSEAKDQLTIVPAGIEVAPHAARDAARRVGAFRLSSQALERRSSDLEALRREHAATLASIEQAKAEQVRLSQEVGTLAAELTSLEARQAAARTREAVGDATLTTNGYALARERLDEIRAAISEKDRLLRYYEVRRESAAAEGDLSAPVASTPAEAVAAIDEALASWPSAR